MCCFNVAPARFLNVVVLALRHIGKHTQALLLATQFQLCIIHPAQLVRSTDISALLKPDHLMEWQAALENHSKIPDHLLLELMLHRIQSVQCRNGFVIEDFPRTRQQAVQVQICSDS